MTRTTRHTTRAGSRSTAAIDAVCPELDVGAAVAKTSGITRTAARAMEPKTTRGSTAAAIVPSTGPSMVPKVEAPIVMPSARPRLLGDDALASQARPPPQMPPQPIPCMTRATSRTTTLRPNPKTKVRGAEDDETDQGQGPRVDSPRAADDECAHDDAGRVGPGEQPRLQLGERELVRVVGQQWRDTGEQRRLEGEQQAE